MLDHTLTLEDRRAATVTVIDWLTETCGPDVANAWAWEHTPMPCGLPSDEQLAEGLSWAAAGREAALPMMVAARDAYEREVEAVMAALPEDI